MTHDDIAHQCARVVRGCAADEQYTQLTRRIAEALQDAFDMGFKAAGGNIYPLSPAIIPGG